LIITPIVFAFPGLVIANRLPWRLSPVSLLACVMAAFRTAGKTAAASRS
jgi:hypothetical protein